MMPATDFETALASAGCIFGIFIVAKFYSDISVGAIGKAAGDYKFDEKIMIANA